MTCKIMFYRIENCVFVVQRPQAQSLSLQKTGIEDTITVGIGVVAVKAQKRCCMCCLFGKQTAFRSLANSYSFGTASIANCVNRRLSFHTEQICGSSHLHLNDMYATVTACQYVYSNVFVCLCVCAQMSYSNDCRQPKTNG